MSKRQHHFMKTYLSNLDVHLIKAGFINCGENWEHEGFMMDYNKFYYICEGEGWVKVGNKEYHPKPGELSFIPGNRFHAYGSISKNFYKKFWCHFTATIGQRQLFELIDLPPIVDVGQDAELMKIFEDLVMYYEEDTLSSALKAKGRLLDLIAYYLDHTHTKEIKMTKSPSLERLEKLIYYIENHLDSPLSVELLASKIHLQPNYFIKFFRGHLGATPMQYVKVRRMESACKHLLSENESISSIAEKVGYHDLSYFSKEFKNHTGYTPSKYRKKEGLSLLEKPVDN